jgi:hypothetical protein
MIMLYKLNKISYEVTEFMIYINKKLTYLSTTVRHLPLFPTGIIGKNKNGIRRKYIKY